MKRLSTIPRKVIKLTQPRQAVCIGCGESVKPGLIYTGSVIDGIGFNTVKHLELQSDASQVEVNRNVSYMRRRKGFLCDSCAADYRTVQYHGQSHPVVMVDARPGYINTLNIPATESWASKLSHMDPHEGTGKVIRRTSHG